MLLRVLALVSVIVLIGTSLLHAQDINALDFSNFNINQVSESQISRLSSELQSNGVSLSQARQVAILQGLSSQEADMLLNRIRVYRQTTGQAEGAAADTTGFLRQLTGLYDAPSFEPYQSETDSVPDSLKIFGMDFFREVSSGFEPSLNIPTPVDYEFGPGDEVLINVWGANTAMYELIISPEGAITIPSLGPIQLNGLTLEEASLRIRTRLSSIYSNLSPDAPEQATTFADISLGDIKSVRVRIVGEVKQPGTYTIPSLSDAFNALYLAGGPKETGTFRDIEILRAGERIATFDLYEFMVGGEPTGNIRIQNDDMIRVGTYKNRIHVTGESKRVGFFELTEGETFEDLVSYIGGFTEQAYTQSFVIERSTPTMRELITLRYPGEAEILMRHGDKVRVQPLLNRYENRVSINGAVMRPGNYELETGMTLYELIEHVNGLREDAFMSRGTITRLGDNRVPETVPFSPGELMNDPSSHDIVLRRDDSIRIESLFDMREEYTINISGAVNRPGEYSFNENTTVQDAIFMANGFLDEAAAYRVEVARRVTGEGESLKMDLIAERHYFEVEENLQFDPSDTGFTLRPFDRVYVRTRPNYQRQQTVRIEGEVQFPAEYVLEDRRARVSDLIEWAGGLSAYAYPEGANLTRRLVDDPRLERDDLPEEVRLSLENENGGEADTATTGEDAYLRTSLALRLHEVLENPGGPGDYILHPGDVLRVPKELETVRIEGEVLFPVSVEYQPGRSFSSYLDAAGGLTENGIRRRAYVVYANGEVDRARNFLGIRSNPDIEPGATIVIPAKPERRELTPQERIGLASSIASTALLFITLIDRLQ